MGKGSIFLIALLLLGLCMTAAAEEGEPTVYTSGDYQYILLADGTAEITKYSGKEKELSVPDTLDGHSVTSIGDDAFSGCFALTSITLPEGITSIGDGAFSVCSFLTSITLPDSVTEMGINPFRGCEKLTDIRVSPDQPMFATMDGVLFNKAEKKLICYPRAFTATEYQVPGGIRSIGDRAFSGCDSLTSIMLPEGLIHIGDDTFFGCDSLTSITLPDSVTEMGINPFRGCEKLTDIRVSPAQPVFATIDGVLFNKTEKKLICYPYAFTASEYQVPKGILSIGDDAFSGCDSLTSITLPEGLTSIGDYAFYWCTSLMNITLPEGLTSIGDHAFSGCFALTSITLPEGLTSIGDSAFSACKSLQSITLPESLTSIGNWVFEYCPEDMQFTVVRDSWAAQWCKENGKNYTFPDVQDWLNN